MNENRFLVALIVLAVAVNFTTVEIRAPEPDERDEAWTGCLGLPALILQGAELQNVSSRTVIFEHIVMNPGTHFRGICDALDMSVGVVQYNVERLVSMGMIVFRRDQRYKRFFEARRYGDAELTVYSLLRRDTTRRILGYLDDNGGAYHQELVKQLGLTSQSVTWHIRLLRSRKVIDSTPEGVGTYYEVDGGFQGVVSYCLEHLLCSR
jgi:predicted transcriptional regulator